MKVQITCPVPEKELQAGKIYDLPDDEARELIEKEMAFLIEETTKKSVKPKKEREG